jgi:quercetin dioxygenase-like cupin family protein
MSSSSDKQQCHQMELVSLYALRALPANEMAAVEAHIRACLDCSQEMESLRPTIDSLAFWPIDVLRPSESLWGRLANRIAAETGRETVLPARQPWSEPAWEEVAPGITCKLLATDSEQGRVSMLVRLAPGVDYPPHTHGGVEELHLLHGELWVNDRKLFPGDYNRAEPGTSDKRVWSETGCTCVLITSTRDVIG